MHTFTSNFIENSSQCNILKEELAVTNSTTVWNTFRFEDLIVSTAYKIKIH